jgi:hypothetical protein
MFFDVSQVLQRALDYESRAKESRNFSRTSDKPRNECHVNMVEYSSESSDDEEVDMCVAEWSWGSKSKPFICSNLKPASKSRQDEMCYMFVVAKCDRTFDYLLLEKQIKLQVVMSYRRQNSSKSIHFANDLILILILLMIAMFSIDRFNQP